MCVILKWSVYFFFWVECVSCVSLRSCKFEVESVLCFMLSIIFKWRVCGVPCVFESSVNEFYVECVLF